MKDLPAEILISIFKHLGHADRCTCLRVCKAWYAPASECFNKEVSLFGYRGIRKLYTSLCSTSKQSMSGALIKKIRFIRRTNTGSPLQAQEYLDLIGACPNLQKIVYVDVNPVVYLSQMAQEHTLMEHLQDIYVPTDYRWSTEQDYLTVIHNNKESITTLRISDSTGYRSLIDSTLSENLPSFLEEFPALETLNISTSNNISITAILNACPNLDKLSIPNRVSQLIAENDDLSNLPAYTTLSALHITASSLSTTLCKLVLHKLTRLRELKIISTGSYFDLRREGAMQRIIDSLNVFQEQLSIKPSITTLVLKSFHGTPQALIHVVSTCFPYLDKLEFIDCSFMGVWDEFNNLSLDFGAMDLHMLSIDVTGIVNKKLAIKQGSVQITLGDSEEEKIYYDRKGKLRTNHSFNRKTNKLYINNIGKRLRDMNVVVLKIKIESLGALKLYAKNSKTQTLSIKQ